MFLHEGHVYEGEGREPSMDIGMVSVGMAQVEDHKNSYRQNITWTEDLSSLTSPSCLFWFRWPRWLLINAAYRLRARMREGSGDSQVAKQPTLPAFVYTTAPVSPSKHLQRSPISDQNTKYQQNSKSKSKQTNNPKHPKRDSKTLQTHPKACISPLFQGKKPRKAKPSAQRGCWRSTGRCGLGECHGQVACRAVPRSRLRGLGPEWGGSGRNGPGGWLAAWLLCLGGLIGFLWLLYGLARFKSVLASFSIFLNAGGFGVRESLVKRCNWELIKPKGPLQKPGFLLNLPHFSF